MKLLKRGDEKDDLPRRESTRSQKLLDRKTRKIELSPKKSYIIDKGLPTRENITV